MPSTESHSNPARDFPLAEGPGWQVLECVSRPLADPIASADPAQPGFGTNFHRPSRRRRRQRRPFGSVGSAFKPASAHASFAYAGVRKKRLAWSDGWHRCMPPVGCADGRPVSVRSAVPTVASTPLSLRSLRHQEPARSHR